MLCNVVYYNTAVQSRVVQFSTGQDMTIQQCSAVQYSPAVSTAECRASLSYPHPASPISLHCTKHPSFELQHTLLPHNELYFSVMYCIAQNYSTLHCTALSYTALHCATLHCIALDCTALHCTTSCWCCVVPDISNFS